MATNLNSINCYYSSWLAQFSKEQRWILKARISSSFFWLSLLLRSSKFFVFRCVSTSINHKFPHFLTPSLTPSLRDTTGSHLNLYDYVWLYMTIDDYLWLFMTMYDYVWLCILSCPVWSLLAPVGPVWPVWPRLTLFDPVLHHLALFGTIWACLAPLGPLSPAWPLFNFHFKAL